MTALSVENDEVADRSLALAGGPGTSLIFDAGLLEPEPGDQSAHVAIGLVASVEGVRDPAADQAEVAGVLRDLHVRRGGDQLVDDLDHAVSPLRVAGPDGAHAVHDVVALAPLLEEPRDDLGRVLEVRIQDHDRLPGCDLVAGGQGGLHAEVAAEPDVLPARVPSAECLDQRLGAVRAAVVDDDELEVVRQTGQALAQLLLERADVVLLVTGGDDDRDQRAHVSSLMGGGGPGRPRS